MEVHMGSIYHCINYKFYCIKAFAKSESPGWIGVGFKRKMCYIVAQDLTHIEITGKMCVHESDKRIKKVIFRKYLHV